MKFRLSIFFVCFLTLNTSIAQNKEKTRIDSLKQASLNQDTEGRLKALIELGTIYRHIDSDSAMYYFDRSRDFATLQESDYYLGRSLLNIGIVRLDMGMIDEALTTFNKAIKVSEKVDDLESVSKCNLNIGLISYFSDSYQHAKECFAKSLAIDIELEDKRGMSNNYGNIGLVFHKQSLYDSALVYYFKQLKLAEEIEYIRGQSNCYGNIGSIYTEQGFHEKAIEYYKLQNEKATEIDYKRGIGNSLGSIGNAYTLIGNYSMAKEFLNQSYLIKKDRGDKYGIATILHNLGEVETKLESYDAAIQNFKEAIAIVKKIDDLSSLATSYNALANVYILQYDSGELIVNDERTALKNALKYANKSFSIGQKIESLALINQASTTLMKTYKRYNNFGKALQFAELSIQTKDSIHNNNVSNAIAELQVKHETEKQQLYIEQMEQQNELDKKLIEIQQATNKKQKIFIVSILFGLVILAGFLVVIIRMFFQKRKINLALAQQKQELAIQNEIISKQKKGLTDSITYANRIQSAILPESKIINQSLPEHFVLFKPRDIVSGDFYWFGTVNNKIIAIVADCTGHGVPGAFMSMLGTAFLNEIVVNLGITTPSEILDRLRNKIIKSLKQKGLANEARDGMDIAAISYQPEFNKMEYSGAYNPLYYIKNGSNELSEIKANKQPIGYYIKMVPFVNHELEINKGDLVYLFTDGFADQFGGSEAKKYKYKPFKQLLVKNHLKPMCDQMALIDEEFNNWRGSNEQVDDICILGFKGL